MFVLIGMAVVKSDLMISFCLALGPSTPAGAAFPVGSYSFGLGTL